jgi:hypothetical protein
MSRVPSFPRLLPVFCRGRSQSRWSARSEARTYDFDSDLSRRKDARPRGGRPRSGLAGVVTGAAAGARLRAGSGRLTRGGGPHRCAPAQDAAGQAAAPVTTSPAAPATRRRSPRRAAPRATHNLRRNLALAVPSAGAPVGRALEVVWKVVTATRSVPCAVPLDASQVKEQVRLDSGAGQGRSRRSRRVRVTVAVHR